jgi:hypothetical protein
MKKVHSGGNILLSTALRAEIAAMALACFAQGLPSVHGPGIDQLPTGVATEFDGSLVRPLDGEELSRAFQVTTLGLLSEIQHVDESLFSTPAGNLLRLSEPPL